MLDSYSPTVDTDSSLSPSTNSTNGMPSTGLEQQPDNLPSPTGETPTSGFELPDGNGGGGGLGPGAIAGIAVVSAVAVLGGAALIWKRQKDSDALSV